MRKRVFDIAKPDDSNKTGGVPPVAGGPASPKTSLGGPASPLGGLPKPGGPAPATGGPTPPSGGPLKPPTGGPPPPMMAGEPSHKELMEELKTIKETLARIETKCGG